MTISVHAASVPADYPRLVDVWRSSVIATHDFLTASDRDAIEQALIPSYFPQVDLTVADDGNRIVGFSGAAGARLEMLFVDAAARGGGVGGILLNHAVDESGVTDVDVNEQNAQAVGFYRRFGFIATGRSETDGEGRPYPLLHMTKEKSRR